MEWPESVAFSFEATPLIPAIAEAETWLWSRAQTMKIGKQHLEKLDIPVSKWFPSLASKPTDKLPVAPTLWQLLSPIFRSASQLATYGDHWGVHLVRQKKWLRRWKKICVTLLSQSFGNKISRCCHLHRHITANYSKISCLGSDLDGGWWRDVQLLLSTVTLYFPNLSQSFPYPKYPWKIKHRLPSAPSPLAKPGTAQVRCSEFGCFTRTRR